MLLGGSGCLRGEEKGVNINRKLSINVYIVP